MFFAMLTAGLPRRATTAVPLTIPEAFAGGRSPAIFARRNPATTIENARRTDITIIKNFAIFRSREWVLPLPCAPADHGAPVRCRRRTRGDVIRCQDSFIPPPMAFRRADHRSARGFHSQSRSVDGAGEVCGPSWRRRDCPRTARDPRASRPPGIAGLYLRGCFDGPGDRRRTETARQESSNRQYGNRVQSRVLTSADATDPWCYAKNHARFPDRRSRKSPGGSSEWLTGFSG